MFQKARKYNRIGRSHDNIYLVRARVKKGPRTDIHNKLGLMKP